MAEIIAVAEVAIALALAEMQQFKEDMRMMQMIFDDDSQQYVTRDRKMWVRPHQTDAIWLSFSSNLVIPNEWIESFRMTRNCFYKLVHELSPVISKQDTRFRLAIPPEKRVGITLHYLHDEGRLRSTAKTFGVGKSTVSDILRQVCWAIAKVVGPKYIRLPESETEMKDLVEGYEREHGMAQAWAATDGSHIFIKQPSLRPNDYLNRKSRYSINVMATADYKYRFVDVSVACPGSMHDASIFVASPLYAKLSTGALPTYKRELIPDRPKVPAFLLGDAAYPLSTFLMKEYPDGGKDVAEKFFSQKLSSARIVIECAFGRVKGKWKCLQRDMDINMNDLPAVIYSCFVLHNFILENAPIGLRQPDEMSVQDAVALQRLEQPETVGSRGNPPLDAKGMQNILKDYLQ